MSVHSCENNIGNGSSSVCSQGDNLQARHFLVWHVVLRPVLDAVARQRRIAQYEKIINSDMYKYTEYCPHALFTLISASSSS